MKSCAQAAFAAATISSSLAPGLAERDVGADGVAEQIDVLPDIGGLVPQRVARHGRDRLAVDQDVAVGHLVEPQQQRQHRRLAAAGGADQSGDLAGLGDKAHAVEHGFVRAVGEGDVAQFDPRIAQLQRRLVVIGRLAGGAVDDLEQLARADQIAVELDVEPRQPFCRLIGQQERGQEREELARRRARERRRGSRHTSARPRPRNRRAFPSTGWSGWRPAPSCWRCARLR